MTCEEKLQVNTEMKTIPLKAVLVAPLNNLPSPNDSVVELCLSWKEVRRGTLSVCVISLYSTPRRTQTNSRCWGPQSVASVGGAANVNNQSAVTGIMGQTVKAYV